MKCPYCGAEMEKGELRSKGGVYFLPEGEGVPLLYTQSQMDKHRAVCLPPYANSLTAAEYPTAYVCRACSKLIVEY